MKGVKKWKKHLQSIGFPNFEKLSDDKILDLMYSDVPARLELLKWISYQISDKDDTCFEMTPEDISTYLCDLGLLKRNNAYDFIHARCSEKEQKSYWKVIFSFTRMKKYFSSVKNKQKNTLGKDSKSKIPERALFNAIKEIDYETDSSVNIRHEIDDLSKGILKTEKSLMEDRAEFGSENNISNDNQLTRTKNQKGYEKNALMKLNNVKASKFRNAFKPMFFTPNMEDFLDECRTKSNDKNGASNMELEYKPSDMKNFPRLFIPPGAPPLGQLDRDPSKYRIKIEDTAPPISINGEPHMDLSSWDYKIYHIKK